MGMGIKSLKWEGIGTKNLFPHTSTAEPDLLNIVNDLSSDYLKFIVRSTYDSDIQRAESSPRNIVG